MSFNDFLLRSLIKKSDCVSAGELGKEVVSERFKKDRIPFPIVPSRN